MFSAITEDAHLLAQCYRNAIWTGRLNAGQSIRLDDETEGSDVSRRVVKQAMRLLANSGIVTWEDEDTVKIINQSLESRHTVESAIGSERGNRRHLLYHS